MVLHHRGVVLSHPVTREQFARACINSSCKDSLDLIDGLLLLHVRLAKPSQDALLITLKLLRLAVFRSNLYNLLLNRFIFLLADGGPLLRRNLVSLLSNPILAGFNVRLPLLQ